ncbi:MAG: anthranilate phosphoribosyltransferase [Kiritimatiellae bacterium]|nr:anthranilate phosphoribosyltransferase [Kiritimatiellia bacterium]MDW8458717.1 anthranilate phosphoribosyltransferase [Verrucomicrobiota bacterium]
MIREAIAKLVENQPLTHEEAHQTLREIMSGEATPAQIAAFITALRIRGETPDVIAGGARAMREHFTAVRAPGRVVVDTCGTGGDGSRTFNISTAAAFVAAGAGATVAKHGNRSVSSRSGSADVLEALGVKIGISAEEMERCLETVGIAFLFAPTLHPAMKHALGPRREIGIRTIFNILGPLSNPAGARYGVLGVYHRDLVLTVARALSALDAARVFVVHGQDGLDEITNTTSSWVADVRGQEVNMFTFDPREYGIPYASPEDLAGGTPAENAAIIRAVLDGEKGPRRDIVCLNAAAALVAGGLASNFSEGIEQARQAIDSGRARAKLDALIAATSVA